MEKLTSALSIYMTILWETVLLVYDFHLLVDTFFVY